MRFKKVIFLLVLFKTLSLWGQDFLSLYKVDSIESIAKCYAIIPYQFQKRQVGSSEILNSCSDKVIAWSQRAKFSDDELLKIAEEVRKGHRTEASLPIFKVVALQSKNQAACDNINLYSAVMAGLKHPIHFPSEDKSDVKAAYQVMSVCLTHLPFFEDLQEELDKDDAYLMQNLCQFFRSKNKKVSQCQMLKKSG